MNHPANLTTPVSIISRTWNLYKTHFDKFAQPLAILFLTSLAQILLELVNFPYKIILVGVFGLIYLILSIWLNVVFIKISEALVDDKKIEIGSIYQKAFYRSPRYIWVSAIYSLILFGGFILLIIPAIFWGIRYAFAPIAAALSDKKLTAKESLQASKALTINRWYDVFSRIVVPQVFCYFILFIVTFGLGFIATGARLSFNELSDNFYFNILSTLTSTIFVPFSILPMIILYKELITIEHKKA
jgi:hypothetical protein